MYLVISGQSVPKADAFSSEVGQPTFLDLGTVTSEKITETLSGSDTGKRCLVEPRQRRTSKTDLALVEVILTLAVWRLLAMGIR